MMFQWLHTLLDVLSETGLRQRVFVPTMRNISWDICQVDRLVFIRVMGLGHLPFLFTKKWWTHMRRKSGAIMKIKSQSWR